MADKVLISDDGKILISDDPKVLIKSGSPCCPTATLVCDQISADATGCGFAAFDGSCRRFLHSELTCTYTIRDDYSVICNPGHGFTRYDDKHYVSDNPYIQDYDEDCNYSSTLGNYTFSETFIDCDGASFPQADRHGTFTGACVGCGATFGCSESTSITADSRITTVTFAGGGGFPVTTGSGLVTETLSNEAPSLCDQAIDDLPSYDDDFDDPCVASKSTDCATYCSISRFKYKFTFADPLTEDCTIYWIERTYDENGEKVSDDLMSETITAEFDEEGNPTTTESSVHECLEPDDDGSKQVLYPIGACCVGPDCSLTDESDCSNQGGIFHGDCTVCEDQGDSRLVVSCTGACCVGTDCSVTDETDCTDNLGGTYQGGGTDCGPPNPCE